MPGSTKYRNWDSYLLENPWVKLYVTPQLGGRIIQMEMDGYEFFFVHPLLAGKEPGSTRLGENGSWLNFGGEKIWPAPQGWNSPDEWPGPPDPVLDSGEYTTEINNENENALKQISPFDPYTGLQIIKEVSVDKSRLEVKVLVTFKNKGNEVKNWSIWPVLQLKTLEETAGQYHVVCPVNPASRFSNGYKIMHGLVNNPQYKIDNHGNLRVDYQYLVGKIGLDTNSKWAAFVDTKTGKVLVLMFQHEKDKTYPENTSFQVWTAGRGMVYSRNVVREHLNDKMLNPPYLEMELLSPLMKIQPGKEFQYEYRMLACTIPKNQTVKSACEFGVVVTPLTINQQEKGVVIQARYGVFSEGILKIHKTKVSENEPPLCLYETKVSPLEGITIELFIDDNSLTECFVSVGLYDLDNHLTEEIDKIKIQI